MHCYRSAICVDINAWATAISHAVLRKKGVGRVLFFLAALVPVCADRNLRDRLALINHVSDKPPCACNEDNMVVGECEMKFSTWHGDGVDFPDCKRISSDGDSSWCFYSMDEEVNGVLKTKLNKGTCCLCPNHFRPSNDRLQEDNLLSEKEKLWERIRSLRLSFKKSLDQPKETRPSLSNHFDRPRIEAQPSPVRGKDYEKPWIELRFDSPIVSAIVEQPIKKSTKTVEQAIEV